VRSARRRALAYARLAELREGVWMRPANVEVVLPPDSVGDLELLVARPSDPLRLVGELWDLTGWSNRAVQLQREMAALPPVGPDELAPGFELSAAVLRHLQADPLLPGELLPEDWPGSGLRTDYDDWDGRYRRVLRAWGRSG
jgi:phenylacetic acid degradation operon negative regulatory protein